MSDVVIVDKDVVSFLLKTDTRAQAYRRHLQGKTLAVSFVTVTELHQWARLSVECQRQGRPISTQHAWIATTALRHRCPLATHNRDDYAAVAGLDIISDI